MMSMCRSNLFPLNSLCIESGKAVWVLYADVVCLNYDGNILDASLLALVTALTKCNYDLNDQLPDQWTDYIASGIAPG